jgi:Uma2 family endonuclease
MAIDAALLTAEEYAALRDAGLPTELVRGEIFERNIPTPRHGQVCSKTAHIIGLYDDEHDAGHVVCNDTGVLTERDPDTVRGPDVWFISYKKVPKGPMPGKYLDVPPDMAFEIKSPSDIWIEVIAKVAEFLEAGVGVVCVLDPETESARVFYPNQPFEILTGDDELTFPEHLPGFSLPVRRFFE